MAIAAILRRDHHCSGNFLQDGGEEIYRNGTEGSNPAYSGGESCELQPVSRGAHRAKRRTNLRSTVYCECACNRAPLIGRAAFNRDWAVFAVIGAFAKVAIVFQADKRG